MFDQYLVTGATGFLGRAVAEELVRRRAQVHALVLRDDPYVHLDVYKRQVLEGK